MSFYRLFFAVSLIALATLIIPVVSNIVSAKTYYVDSYSDFINAVEYARDGDAIVFTGNLDINLYYADTYNNYNNNGQYLAYGQWSFYNMSITITATPNATVRIFGSAIRLHNCHDVEISGLELNYTDIWVEDGSRNIVIKDNVFHHGGIIWLKDGSSVYTIVNNEFLDGGGIKVDYVRGGGNVYGNTVNGFPLLYVEKNGATISGMEEDYGQVVVVNSRNVSISFLDMRSEKIGQVMNPLVVSGSSSVELIGSTFDTGTVTIFNSTDVDINDSIFNANKSYILEIAYSNGITLRNSRIKILSEKPRQAILVEMSVDIRIDSNEFKAQYEKVGSGFPTFIRIYKSNKTTIKDNNFTANIIDRFGRTTRTIPGVIYTGSIYLKVPNSDIVIQGNRFENLISAIWMTSPAKNVLIVRNIFDNMEYYAIGLDEDTHNATIACNLFNNSVISVNYDKDITVDAHIYMNAFLRDSPGSIFYHGGVVSFTNDTMLTPVPLSYEYNSVTHSSKLGNYYSWHDNTDADRDGIADNPIYVGEDYSIMPPREIYDTKPIADPAILLMCGTPLPSSLVGGGGTGGAGGGEGSSTPPLIVAPTSVTFPPTEPGNTVSATITISNTLGEAVELTSVNLRGDTGVFAVNLSSPYTLPPGGSVVVKIAYKPSAYTSYSAVLAVATNLTTEPTLEVTLTAQAKKALPLPQQTVETLGKRAEAAKRIGKLIAVISNLPNITAGKAGAHMVFQQLKRMDLDKLVNGVSVTKDTLSLDANGDGKVDALDLVNYLSSQGLMKKPPKTTRAFSQQLLKTLQKLYGQNLENYPTPEGKLWVLALQIESTQQD